MSCARSVQTSCGKNNKNMERTNGVRAAYDAFLLHALQVAFGCAAVLKGKELILTVTHFFALLRSMKRARDVRDQLEGLMQRTEIEVTSNINDTIAIQKV